MTDIHNITEAHCIKYGGTMALFTIDSGKSVVMGMRNPNYHKNQKHEVSYECPGGKLELGETLVEGVVREVGEEFHLNLKTEDFKDAPYSTSHDSSVNKTNVIFVVDLDKIVPQSEVKKASSEMMFFSVLSPSSHELTSMVSIDTNELIDKLESGEEKPTFKANHISDRYWDDTEVKEEYPLRAFNTFLIKAAIKDGLLKRY